MEHNGLSAADVALLNNNGNGNNGVVNTSFFWIFALLILAGGGFGGGFGGNNNNQSTATREDVYSGFNFNGVNNKLDSLTLGQANLQQSLGGAVCASTYELADKINKCCCDNQQQMAQMRYDMAMQSNQTQNMIMQQASAGRELVLQNKIENMQGQIYQLQMDKMACGLPRISNDAWGVTPLNNCAQPQSNCGWGGCY